MRHPSAFAFAVSILSVVLVWGQSPAPTTLPSAAIPDCLGVNIHLTDPKPGEMAMLAGGGFKWVRMDMLWNESWSSVEKVKGVYDFSAYDRLMASLEPHQIRPLIIFAYRNRLYDNGLSPYTDEGRAAFAAYAVAAAKHFAGRGIVWETWNEPNGRTFWHPTPKAEDYAKLAITVGKAFRQEVPNEMLVGPALEKFDWPFMETCFKAGVLEYWSAVSVHPYRDGPPETAAEDYRKLRQMIARYAPAGKDIPILSSEWGYASIAAGLGVPTPEIQGKYLARQWLTNIANEIPISIWYDWHDDGTNPKDIEHHFGTVANAYHQDAQPVYDPKPAYLAAKALTTIFSGYQFSKRLLMDSPDDYVLVFTKAGDTRLAVWTTGPAHELTLPLSAGTFTVTSATGENLPNLTCVAAGLNVQVNDTPQYLVAQASNDLLRLAGAWQGVPLEVKVTAPTTAVIQTALSNPTARTIHVKSSTGQDLDLPAGQSAIFAISVPVLRSQRHEVYRMELTIDGQKFAQETRIAVRNPLDVILLPIGDQAIMARIENPSLQTFSGTITFAAVQDAKTVTASAPLELAAGQRETMVRAEAAQPLPLNPRLEVMLKDTAGQIIADSMLAYDSQPAQNFNAYSMWPVKDQSFVAAAAPEAPPTLRGPVMKLDYSFTAAEKNSTTKPAAEVVTLTIGPPANKPNLAALPGKPRTVSMWVYGDGQSNGVCARTCDATGQIFQPASAITWKGWQLLTLPLDDNGVWHYAGAKDGQIHYPIKWNSLFLLDSAGRATRKGTIYLASPTVLWDQPPQAP